MIDRLQHVKSFVTVAHLHNFARAARQLYLSPSSLTAHIQQLETELGTKLFTRTTRKIALTQAGQDLLIPMERILMEIESISTSAGEFRDLRRGLVAVAATPSISARLLPQAIAEFSKSYPGISVRFTDAVGKNIIALLLNGQVDFGIGSCQISPSDAVSLQHLFTESILVFVPKRHLWRKKQTITLLEVSSQLLILPGKHTTVRSILENEFRQQELVTRLHCETDNMSTALGMVAAGLGIAILPQSALDCGCCTDIHTLEISDPGMVREVSLITRRDRPLSKASERLVQTVLSQAEASSLAKGKTKKA